MKLSTGRDALFTQLQTVTRAASTRSAIQALSGVQVIAAGSSIELRATDMEIGLRVPLEGEVVREGSAVLPARLLVDVVRALPGDGVSLELRPAEQDVELKGGNATFHIRTLRLEDFPPFPEANVPARALQELTRIVGAAEADDLAVSVRTNQVVFEVGGTVLSSRLIDGQFPNYRQLLPDAFEHELTLTSGELTEVVRRVSLMAQKNAPLRLAFG